MNRDKLIGGQPTGIEFTRLEIAEIATAVRHFRQSMLEMNGLAFWDRAGCASKWQSILGKLQKAVDENNFVLDDEIVLLMKQQTSTTCGARSTSGGCFQAEPPKSRG